MSTRDRTESYKERVTQLRDELRGAEHEARLDRDDLRSKGLGEALEILDEIFPEAARR